MKKRVLHFVIVFVIAASIYFAAGKGAELVSALSAGSGKVTVVIDPGHGGRDPGKVGIVDEVEEKGINLAISLFLKDYLEEQGINVILTRESDVGLYSESASNKKREDLNNRLEIINSSKVDFAVGIHQNSFTQSQYKGAQVFYYQGSEEGIKLAKALQSQLIEGLDPSNTRTIKANTNYYLLENSSVPMVIVEAGFLSNPEECALLSDAEYQKKVAENIGIGIMNYINGK